MNHHHHDILNADLVENSPNANKGYVSRINKKLSPQIMTNETL